MKNGMVFLLVFVVMMGSLSLIVVVVGVPLPGLDNHNRFRFIQQDAPDWNGGNSKIFEIVFIILDNCWKIFICNTLL